MRAHTDHHSPPRPPVSVLGAWGPPGRPLGLTAPAPASPPLRVSVQVTTERPPPALGPTFTDTRDTHEEEAPQPWAPDTGRPTRAPQDRP